MRSLIIALGIVIAGLLGFVATGCGGTAGADGTPQSQVRPGAGRPLPPIVVEQPRPAERVASPVTVAGSADVFEANVTVRILDAGGAEIARTFTTASCGTGCRGTFSLAAPYRVDAEQRGTVVVQDDDAAGVGRPPHVVRIPVLLGTGS